jgi:predicted Zn-dependent protease
MLQKPRTTSMHGISPDIKFYVDGNFERTYKPYSEVYRKIEKQVETEYKQSLAHKCTNEKSYRKNRIYQVHCAYVSSRWTCVANSQDNRSYYRRVSAARRPSRRRRR